MTPAHRRAIEERLARATPGPWGYDFNRTIARHHCGEWEETVAQIPGKIGPQQRADADFFAHAPEDLRALLAYVRELEGRLEDAHSLAKNLPDSELDLAREAWGNTNVAVVKHWRDAVLAASLDTEAKPA